MLHRPTTDGILRTGSDSTGAKGNRWGYEFFRVFRSSRRGRRPQPPGPLTYAFG